MKKILIGFAVLALLVGVKVMATSNDWHFNLRNTANNADINYDLPVPGDTEDRVIMLDGTSKLPKFIAANGGLTVDPIDGLIVEGIEPEKVIGLDDLLNEKASDSSLAELGNDTAANFNYVFSALGQSTRVQTNTSGTYTWTFPNAYASGITPVVEVVAEDATSGALTSAQITAISNTSVTVQTRRITTVLGLLTLTTNPQVYVHITAVKP